jgi:hypothetical protein
MMQKGEEADIYKDPLYARSQHWDLSTSGLFPGQGMIGTGFGSVVGFLLIFSFSCFIVVIFG